MGISKRISPLNIILALHMHYEKKKKNQKSKARYAVYFLTVLYQRINLIKAAGSFRQNKFCKDFETFFLNIKAQGLCSLYKV